MPAVIVDDITVLPRIPQPDPTVTTQRPVRSITTAPRGFEGEGFPVRRAFAGVDLMDLDPFIHLDQMGEVEYAPGEPKGTPWHPHRGFETVTYMIDGTFEHSDSNGGGGVITNGDTQWMTAGAGILHIEKPPEALVVSGGLFHGFQLWVNLPRVAEVGGAALPGHPGEGGRARLLGRRWRAGARHRGRRRRLRRPGLHVQPDDPGPCVAESWRALVAAVAPGLQRPRLRHGGAGDRGPGRAPDRQRPAGGPGSGDAITVSAATYQESRSPNLDVLILGGRPIREPVAWMGPFVMNTREEVLQAMADYQAGRLGTIPAVHGAPTTLTESAVPDR